MPSHSNKKGDAERDRKTAGVTRKKKETVPCQGEACGQCSGEADEPGGIAQHGITRDGRRSRFPTLLPDCGEHARNSAIVLHVAAYGARRLGAGVRDTARVEGRARKVRKTLRSLVLYPIIAFRGVLEYGRLLHTAAF